MLYHAQSFLKESEYKNLRKNLLMCSEWKDGIKTVSGSNRQEIKRNLQLIDGETYEKSSEFIINAIKNNPSIENYAFPSEIFQILFTRTGPGMYYGPHIDIALIGGKRRDLSFTIFLNDKKEYSGGELILCIPPERRNIKLNAGDIIIYPTKYIHEVKEVTQGERIVCVGWIQSEIINDDDRDILSLFKQSLVEIENNPSSNPLTKLNFRSALNRLHKSFSSLS